MSGEQQSTEKARLTMVVCNDDWGTPATDLPHLVRAHRPMLWATQESKGLDYRALLAKDGFGVRQRTSTVGSQGVAVGWDRRRVQALAGKGRHGWEFLADNAGLEPRGVVWQDVEVRSTGLRLRLASTHRPPIRYRHLWPTFDTHLSTWLDWSRLPVLLGMDSNEEGGPTPLIHGDYRWHGHRIDGVLTSLPGAFTITDLPLRTSDHHPLLVLADLRFSPVSTGGQSDA